MFRAPIESQALTALSSCISTLDLPASRQLYSLSPCAIGARYYGYILSPLLRSVPATTGIFSLPFCDRCPLR
eukprot:6240014-Pyramimonas_sp.AAC.1